MQPRFDMAFPPDDNVDRAGASKMVPSFPKMGQFGSLELLSIIDLKKLMAKDHNLITKVFRSLTPLRLELNECRDVRAILGG